MSCRGRLEKNNGGSGGSARVPNEIFQFHVINQAKAVPGPLNLQGILPFTFVVDS